MKTWIKIILFIIGLLILYELVLTYTRYLKRKRIFDIAKKSAQDLGKPLMVIGDPDNGATNFMFGRCYECGDVCLDITGCPSCSNGIKQKIEDYLPTLECNSYVIFISCVLEYVDTNKLDFIMKEINRVSGGNYYIVSVEPMSLTALLYPTRWITGEHGSNQMILTEYPNCDPLEYIPIH